MSEGGRRVVFMSKLQAAWVLDRASSVDDGCCVALLAPVYEDPTHHKERPSGEPADVAGYRGRLSGLRPRQD
jgi:hypothetical protein